MKTLLALAKARFTALLSAGVGLMLVAALLIVSHINVIMDVRDVSVPLVGKLPQLERRLDALKQQIELTELHAAVRTGSQQENVEVYALPSETNVSRIVATFEVIADALRRDDLLSSMDTLEISNSEERDDDLRSRTLSTELSLHEDGLKTLLLLIRLSGLLTVGDVLTEQHTALLVDRVEQENPSGIVSLEQFLAADLLRYAEDPKAYEEQLKRSFSSTTFLNAFENVLRTSLLYDVKILLRSDLGEALAGYKLWPMQAMAVQEITLSPGKAKKWHNLKLVLEVFEAMK